VKPVDLSIVVPVYHESEMLPNKLAELDAFLETKDYGQVEVLLVTQSAADTRAAEKHSSRGANYRVLDLKKRAGKGGAVKAGMLNARGRYRLYMDADLATPLRHIDDAWRAVREGADLAVAVRNLWKTWHWLANSITKLLPSKLQIGTIPKKQLTAWPETQPWL
jgi:dolichyl-phosphate beta-glucosyltransferase